MHHYGLLSVQWLLYKQFSSSSGSLLTDSCCFMEYLTQTGKVLCLLGEILLLVQPAIFQDDFHHQKELQLRR